MIQKPLPAIVTEAQVVLGDDALEVLQRDGGRLLDRSKRLAVSVQPDGAGYFLGGNSYSSHGL